jgi:hypothetical protein
LAYVHLNPVRAGLVDDPSKYRWSGHREIIGKEDFGLVDPDEVLIMFADERRTARRAYVKALNAEGSASWVGEEPSKLPWWQIVKDEPVSPREDGIYVDYLGRSTAPERPHLPVAEYLAKACQVLAVEVEELAGRGRSPRLTELRELVAVVGVEKYGQRVNQLAEKLRKNPGSVSRWVTSAAERRTTDSGFAERMRRIDDALQKDD